MRFETYSLGELVSIKYGKNQKKVLSENGAFPIYGTGGLMGYATKALYDKPSVLIGRKGTIEKIRYVNHPFWTVDTLFYTIVNDNIVIPQFLYYAMLQLDLLQYNEGTTIPSLRTETLNRIELRIPNIDNQKRILHYLATIDEKIELNTKINENLDQQAQAIFKSWFVDFEPFGGIMPDDWRMGTLSEIAEINSGKRPPMRQADKTDNVYVPLVGAASVMGYTNESNHSDKILVIGRVGTHGIVQRFNIPCWTSDNTLVLTSPYYEYTYQVLKRIDYTAMNRGSTQPLITQGDMNKAEIFLPDKKYILKYESLVGTLFAQYEHNRAENENLAALRDTLLPKLMNGEIDVSEVNI